MEKEIEVATTWWADQLRQVPKHDNGDLMHNALAAWASERTRRVITEDQIERFRTELVERWVKRNTGNWRPGAPGWGSSLRVLATDYAPAGELAEALEAAEITQGNLVLPIKTMMWIDPGEVKVSCGYGAGIETLYNNQDDAGETPAVRDDVARAD